MSTVTIQIPEYLRKQVERLCAEEGLDIDQFFATAASEKIAVLEAIDYVAARASQASDAAFEDAVASIPAVPVSEEWDKPSE